MIIWRWLVDAHWELTAALKNRHIHERHRRHRRPRDPDCPKCYRTELRVVRSYVIMSALLILNRGESWASASN